MGTINLSLYKLFNYLPQVWGVKLQNLHTLMCIRSMALKVLSLHGAHKLRVVYIVVIQGVGLWKNDSETCVSVHFRGLLRSPTQISINFLISCDVFHLH